MYILNLFINEFNNYLKIEILRKRVRNKIVSQVLPINVIQKYKTI